MQISTILDKASKTWPDKEAIICGNLKLSYSEFANRSKKLARFFLNSGLQPGDRVAILNHNCHTYLESYFAAAYAGVILVPINFRFSANEVGYVLKDSSAKLLISNTEFEPLNSETIKKEGNNNAVTQLVWCKLAGDEIPELDGCHSIDCEETLRTAGHCKLPNTRGDSTPAHLYYTSGTTGKPKGVILTHTNVVTHAQGTVTEFQLTDSDVWGHIAPLYHLADAWATFAITMVGGKHVIVKRFEPKTVLDTIREQEITLTNLIPTMLNQMVNVPGAAELEYPSLRYLLSGGAPIAPELVKKIMKTFKCDYVQTYGMTETSPYLTVSLLKEYLRSLPEEERFKYQAKTGKPFITVELKVVDENGNEVEPNNEQVGEIWVKGPTITPGYWNSPEETEAAFEDSWLKTGDLAVIDSEGYVNIVDRKKDLIVTGGENVYSTEVEHVLYEHPAILEAAVIGVPDDRWGEAVKAIVVLRSGMVVTPDELINFCKKKLAQYKAPKSVDFIDELPKTGTGKIFKKALKDMYWSGYDKRVH
jgi:acyl-CoA synthetase (AMP-forming)/AMP-acid ligase II